MDQAVRDILRRPLRAVGAIEQTGRSVRILDLHALERAARPDRVRELPRP